MPEKASFRVFCRRQEGAWIVTPIFSNVQTGCIVKGEAQKSALFWRFRRLIRTNRAFLETRTLKTLTSLNKELRLFFLRDNSIWSFPLFLLLAIAAFEGPEGYFSLAIIAFGAFQFIVPKCYYRLGKWNLRSLASLFKEVTVFKGVQSETNRGGRALTSPHSAYVYMCFFRLCLWALSLSLAFER